MDEQLRRIGRLAGRSARDQQATQQSVKREIARLDPPHLERTSAWHVPARYAAGQRPPRGPKPRRAARRRSGMLGWLTLSFGTMGVVCGGIMLGWSAVADRAELWSIGLPVLFGGQIALVIGLLAQLERLWHDSRSAAVKLQRVDRQLHQLHTTTSLIGSGGHSPGGQFYSHLAGGAGPDLLLNDLKGQLDLLAMKISERESG